MASRLTAFALGLVLLLTGCTNSAPKVDDPSSPSATPTASSTPPEQRAQRRLAEALDQLAAEGGLRYAGSLQIERVTWGDLDLQVTSSGVAYGALAHQDQALRVLVLDSETALVRASPAFWKSALSGTGGEEKAKRYAQHWVRVDPQVVSHAGDVLRPMVIAAQLRRLLDEEGVRSVRPGTVGGEAVDVIAVGNSIFHVTKAEPARLLKVHFPELTAPDQATDSESSEGITGSSGHAGNAGLAFLGVRQEHDSGDYDSGDHDDEEGEGAESDTEVPGEDGLGTDAMDLPDIADLYTELSTSPGSDRHWPPQHRHLHGQQDHEAEWPGPDDLPGQPETSSLQKPGCLHVAGDWDRDRSRDGQAGPRTYPRAAGQERATGRREAQVETGPGRAAGQ